MDAVPDNRRRRITLRGILVLSLFVAAFGFVAVPLLRRGTDAYRFEDDAAHLRRALLPPGARILRSTEPVRGRSSVKAAWQFAADMEWDRYRLWILERTRRRFRVVRESESRVVLREKRPADVLTLEVERFGACPLRVEVTFTGEAW